MEIYHGTILSLMMIAATVISFAAGECTDGGLSSGADVLESKPNKVRSRGTIEEAKIKWSIDLNENKKIAQLYDVSKKVLQVKREGDKWEVFSPDKPVVYTGAYTWNVPRIPCLNYTYKLVVPSKNGDTSNDCFVTKTSTLPAESKERIRQAKFIPSEVENLHVAADDSNANLTWTKSLCAEEYQVYIYIDHENVNDGEEKVQIVKNNDVAEAKFSGLDSCTNYLVDIIPAVEGVQNEKTILTKPFHTKPSPDTANNLGLSDLVTTKNSVILNFYNYMPKVNCLKKFSIQVCKKENGSSIDACSDPKIESMNGNNLKYTKDNLSHCTNHALKVTPIYDGINIEPKMVDFTTKFDENEFQYPEIKAGISDVELRFSNMDCFYYYTIKYRLADETEQTQMEYDDGMEGAWKEAEGILTSNLITVNNLSPDSHYQIKLEVKGKSGDQTFAAPNVIDFKTLEDPDRVRSALGMGKMDMNASSTMTMENKTTMPVNHQNGSMTPIEVGSTSNEDNNTSTTNMSDESDGDNETTDSDSGEDDGDDDSYGGNSTSTSDHQKPSTGVTIKTDGTSAESSEHDSTNEVPSSPAEQNSTDDDESTMDDSDDDGNTAGNTENDGDESTTVIIVVIVVVILLAIGAGVGYWFVKGKKGGGGKAGSGSGPVQNQQYDQVPAQDIEAK